MLRFSLYILYIYIYICTHRWLKKSIINSSKILVFQVNECVSFILHNCFKLGLWWSCKQKIKIHDHDYNCFFPDGENDGRLMMNIWQL